MSEIKGENLSAAATAAATTIATAAVSIAVPIATTAAVTPATTAARILAWCGGARLLLRRCGTEFLCGRGPGFLQSRRFGAEGWIHGGSILARRRGNGLKIPLLPLLNILLLLEDPLLLQLLSLFLHLLLLLPFNAAIDRRLRVLLILPRRIVLVLDRCERRGHDPGIVIATTRLVGHDGLEWLAPSRSIGRSLGNVSVANGVLAINTIWSACVE